MLSQCETAALISSLAGLEHGRSRAGIRHILSNPAVNALANDPRLLQIAQDTLGANAFPFRATLFDKSPASNWLITWHQDTSLPLRERRVSAGWSSWSVKDGVIYAHAPASALQSVLALRVHLDDSTERNGPLRVIPGTHNVGVLTDDAIEQIVRTKPAVECLLSLGGVLAMRPLLIHASSKSQTDMPRRVLHIEYSATATFLGGLELAVA
jgi:ectoine hydroxylase-related dioxygenase (phytanoyl-CoA dioxygenase family)